HVPERHLDAECRPLRMDSMCASHHSCLLMLSRFGGKHIDETLKVTFDSFIRLSDDITLCCIHNIRRSEAVMHPLLLLAQCLRHLTGESDDIMTGFGFYLLDAVDIDFSILPDQADLIRRNKPKLRPCFRCQDLHFKPCFKSVLFCPNL